MNHGILFGDGDGKQQISQTKNKLLQEKILSSSKTALTLGAVLPKTSLIFFPQ
jgi:hypothetical protein